MTNNAKVNQWLALHNLVLGESFTAALRRLSKKYQKENHIRRIDDVYRKIGMRKEYIYYWESHAYSVQTKKF